ncbi:M20/M25/M40 family metallo-hydrolase [Patescibacteria group bacterium]|nr:M20/M25/M40 family metallo-hydrolase [Patescibacteria group bacterium]
MELLQKLIQIQSISGNEAEIAKFILDTLQSWGVGARRQNGNVIAYIPGKDGSRALIFNTHMDTVPASNPEKWVYPPYGKNAGRIIRDKLYGLGASDDKGGIAAILNLIDTMICGSCRSSVPNFASKSPSLGWAQGREATFGKPSLVPPVSKLDVGNLPFDLWFTFVAGEETDGSGTEKFLDWFCDTKYFTKYKKISAIIGEPTGNKELEIGHRGNIFLTVTAKGLSGHGAKNYKKEDLAVEKILKIAEKLKSASLIWKKEYRDKFLGEPSLNITGIFSSTNIANVLPAECSLFVDIRTTPLLHEEIKTLLEKLVDFEEGISCMIKERSYGFTSLEAGIVKSFKKVMKGIKLSSSMGTTDMSQFTQRGIETVVFGPGDRECIHKENEFVELSNVSECVKIYRKIIDCF